MTNSKKNPTKNNCFSYKVSSKLTRSEGVVLYLLTTKFLTPYQIAIRRQCSKQAVSKHILNLKKKGYLKHGYNLVDNFRSTSQPNRKTSQPTNLIRLHGQEFNIRILYKDERYKTIRNKANVIIIDGNTIRLYNNSIEIYSGSSFFADDATKATAESMIYFNKLFVRLEHDLKIIIIKSRTQNIRQVNAHYAEINNELAKSCHDRGEKIKVYTNDDGKLWFTIDNSFNLHEAETLHPKTSKPDMDKVKAHFNDIRDKDYIPLSKLSKYIADTTYQINEISHGLKGVVDVLKFLVPETTHKTNEKNIKINYIG